MMRALSTVRRRLRRLARDPGAGVILARAGAAIVLVDVSLRLGGVSRALNGAGETPDGAAQPVDASALRRAERYARGIATAARHHPVRARCLHRALVLHRWLRREGLPSELRIGVQHVNGTFNAHAWVELEGRAVGESAAMLAAFAPLQGLMRAAAATRTRHGLRWL
jgi:hypothetical protein